MGVYFLSDRHWPSFIGELSQTHRIYYPVEQGEDYQLTRAEEGKCPAIPFNRYRMVQPFKSLLFEPRLRVGGYLGGGREARERGEKRVVVGVKACDLSALLVLDFVFTGDVADPFYARNRDQTLIISSDCTGFKDVCFCTLVGGTPHPDRGYDLNLSPVEGGYVVHVGSPRGQALVDGFTQYFAAPAPAQLASVEEQRGRVISLLGEHQQRLGYAWGGATRELMERVYESDVWDEEAKRCVECGACNFVCPTCHCFLLSDHGRETFSRMRNWDSCQYKGFARVGGGANPRPELYQRLRNRYEKKLQFCPEVIGVCGCTGCGRCVEACIGEIDMREVLKKLCGCR